MLREINNRNFQRKENPMSVAKVSEITAASPKSFDDAVKVGVKRASKTLQNVTAAWVHDHEVRVSKGKITEYRVRMKVTFVLKN
jgi:flavin-binding protein dodecin